VFAAHVAFLQGQDLETGLEAAARVRARDRGPSAGGEWAGDAACVDAQRRGRGAGSTDTERVALDDATELMGHTRVSAGAPLVASEPLANMTDAGVTAGSDGRGDRRSKRRDASAVDLVSTLQ
jgi:hypothetical protein